MTAIPLVLFFGTPSEEPGTHESLMTCGERVLAKAKKGHLHIEEGDLTNAGRDPWIDP